LVFFLTFNYSLSNIINIDIDNKNMSSILLPGKSFLSYKLLLIHIVLLESHQSFDCVDSLSIASGELQYFSHYTCLQTFLSGPGESLTSFCCCGISPSGDTLNESSLLVLRAFGWLQLYTAPTVEIPVQLIVHHSWLQLLTCVLPNSESLTTFCCCGISPSGDTLNESSLLIPRAFGWLQSYTALTVEIPVQSTVHHSWSQLLTCIPNNCLSFENQSFVILSPWAILTLPNLKFDYHYTTKSEKYWQEFTDIKSCLNFDCPLESQSYAFWLWNQLRSSPLLELYTRLFLTLFDNFDIVQQHDISAIKVLEVSLKLKQNLFRKHDYAAFMKQLNGASLIIISPAQLTCNLFAYHIGAFKLIEKYLVISKDLIIHLHTY
jgi:hypothetical protein